MFPFYNYLNLKIIVADTCFDTGNYTGNEIDFRITLYDDEVTCQIFCQELTQCKFWTLARMSSGNKRCYRHREQAPTALGTCETCMRGPRFCSGKH